MKQRNSSTRQGQTAQKPGAPVIPLRRVNARGAGQSPEPAALEEGMAALARLLAEAWAF